MAHLANGWDLLKGAGIAREAKEREPHETLRMARLSVQSVVEIHSISSQ